jgi:hygromycin-B 4-O-kinase
MPHAGPTLAKARRMASTIVEHHFGRAARRIVHRSSGLTNFVFEVNHAQGDFVVRLSDQPAKIKAFLKEQWAMERAREVGVPTAEILEVGNEVVPYPYMVALRVRGGEASHHPARLDIARELGEMAARIHTVRTSGFGRTFDWSSNRLSRNETWRAYLRDELDVRGRMGVLKKEGLIGPALARRLASVVAEMETFRRRPVLNHADLRLKNVIVTEAGKIAAIIDWENCESNLAPYWDFAFALHDLGIDAKQMFVEGYGLTWRRYLEIAPVVKAINLLSYAPVLADLAARRKRAEIERLRARFTGAFDLYAV